MLKKLYFQGRTEGLPSQSLFHRHLALTLHEKELFSNYINGNYKNKGVGILHQVPLKSWLSFSNHL